MTAGKRWAPVLGACLATGALLVGGLWWRATRGDASDAAVRTSAASAAAADDGGRRDARRLAFRTRLLADGGVSADATSVRIGLANVSPDDLAAYRAWLRGGREGAGPGRFEDLATVTRWIDAPAAVADDGSVVVGPMSLPAADRYLLQARAGDALRFYETAFGPDDPPDEVRPRVAAGLRVRAPVDGVGVLFRRVDGGGDAQWQSLMRRESPQLLDAYDERPFAVGVDTIVAPLPPGPIEIVAVVDGVETERRRVDLAAGRLAAFDFDAESASLAAALPTTLWLRLIERGSGVPVREATLQWSSPRGERRLRPDAAGVVRIDGVDPLRPLSLQALFPPPTSSSFLIEALPSWPERLPLEVDPKHARIVAGRLEATVELVPLRWLIVETPGIAIPRRPRMGDPYPVFVLQRRDGGTWRDASADHFRPVADGIAVSLDRPGAVRVAALLAPWRVAFSDAVEANVDVARQRTRLDATGGRRVRVRLTVDGRPLPRAPVQVIAPLRGVPPAQPPVDADGRLVLEQVNVPTVRMEVPGYEQVEVRLDEGEVVVALRRERD
ncbi:MAG: hypothetical protein ACOY82_16890 [Pseudomonadota bacterium]